MNENEYQCARCQKVYLKAWTEQDAQAETERYWGSGIPQEALAVVCDDCWQLVQPARNPAVYSATWHQIQRLKKGKKK